MNNKDMPISNKDSLNQEDCTKPEKKGDSYLQKGNHGIGHMSDGEIKGEAKVAGRLKENNKNQSQKANSKVTVNINSPNVSNSSDEKPKKGKKEFVIGAAFIAIVSVIGGSVISAAFLNRFSKTIVDQFFPPKDQVSKIVVSINELNQSISKNSDAVTSVVEQLKQRNSDPGIQQLIAELTKEVNSLTSKSQQIGQRAENLGAITQGIVSDSDLVKGANLWLPVGTSIFIVDDQNTFGIESVLGGANDQILAVLNGSFSSMKVGSRLEFESTSKGNCFVTYFGPEADVHAFGTSCSKD